MKSSVNCVDHSTEATEQLISCEGVYYAAQGGSNLFKREKKKKIGIYQSIVTRAKRNSLTVLNEGD